MNNDFFWFYIEPYIHISLKRDKFLLYNTLNNKYYIDDLKHETKQILLNLENKDNLRVVKLTHENIKHKRINYFIEKIRKFYMGDLIKSSFSDIKPIQFSPYIKISQEFKWNSKNNINDGKNVMNYLHEITLYINNDNSLELEKFADAYKQFNFLTYNDKYYELDLEEIKKIIVESTHSFLFKLNITGGNIFKYKNISELISLLNKKNISIEYYTHYSFLDFILQNKELQNKFNENSKNELIINITELEKVANFEKKIFLLKKTINKYKFVFIIRNEIELNNANAIIESHNIVEYEFKPYYNKQNLGFFKKYVFFNKTDILKSNLNHKEILIKEKINPLFFGKLTILNNGDIYSNVNKPKAGNIKQDTLHEVIYNEMFNSTSWLKTRNKVYPCRKCLFCSLCPPISNYELVLKQNNLCNIIS